MKAGQFSEFADEFWRLDTIPNREFGVRSVITDALWIELLSFIENR
jgi:hypothetical protein